MITKMAGALVDGLNASGDVLDQWIVVNQAGGQQLALGQPVARDTSQLVNVAEGTSVNTTPQNVNPGVSLFVNQSDVALPTNAAANAGDVMGCIQSAPNALAVGANAQPRPVYIRRLGIGWVYAGVPNGGTALTVGALLITSSTYPFAVVGARAFGSNVARITAYPVNTVSQSAVGAPGAVTVNVPSAFGMNTSNPVTIDSGANAETVTPSGVVYGVLATGTVTLAVVAAAAGVTISGTIGGIPWSYVTTAGDTTATILAGHVVSAINATAAVAGQAPVVQTTTNAAGVITINALNPGTAGNAITITATSSNAGAYTAAASGANLAGGTQPSFTATFAKAHASGVPVQGITTTGNIATAPATGYYALPLVADINCLL